MVDFFASPEVHQAAQQGGGPGPRVADLRQELRAPRDRHHAGHELLRYNFNLHPLPCRHHLGHIPLYPPGAVYIS